jgi:hypothetical protein
LELPTEFECATVVSPQRVIATAVAAKGAIARASS